MHPSHSALQVAPLPCHCSPEEAKLGRSTPPSHGEQDQDLLHQLGSRLAVQCAVVFQNAIISGVRRDAPSEVPFPGL